MNDIQDIYNFILLLFKCILIVLIFGIILPCIIDLLIRAFINKYAYYKDGILVFSVLNKNEIVLWNFIYVVNQFFAL
ncbi:endonuclease III [Clostridium ganghwense]|uniref:Endonuclease III n=1 Tax=Clostridium ganghwense TaxID=312089 RepID=A0ABT4CML1_9CLOT|nr:endonuclease III [Clostridium ganghwense]MCY6370300.1 endonuclease III [Clostridium ganghwense]